MVGVGCIDILRGLSYESINSKLKPGAATDKPDSASNLPGDWPRVTHPPKWVSPCGHRRGSKKYRDRKHLILSSASQGFRFPYCTGGYHTPTTRKGNSNSSPTCLPGSSRVSDEASSMKDHLSFKMLRDNSFLALHLALLLFLWTVQWFVICSGHVPYPGFLKAWPRDHLQQNHRGVLQEGFCQRCHWEQRRPSKLESVEMKLMIMV